MQTPNIKIYTNEELLSLAGEEAVPEADLLGEEDDDGPTTRERYKYFMRPEPLEGLGPIQTEFDALTQREMRWRHIDIGMVRNAQAKKTVKVYLDPEPHMRIDKAKSLQGWYKGKFDFEQGQRPRPCFTDAVLTEPYGGACSVSCTFCYINAGFRGYRGSGLATVPIGYGEQVKKMLATMQTATAGYFSSFTDPFLPLESLYHNTEHAAKAFAAVGLPVFFLSRLHYPGWAFDLLGQNKYSYAQKSLNTGIDADFKRFSPGAISLSEHIEEVRELRRRGIYTSIQVNPIVAGVTTHEHIRYLFERLAEAGNNHVIVKFVEAGFSWAPAMLAKLHKRFGDRANAFAELFTDNIGGQKTIVEEYRLEAHAMYRKWATELGMTYATCYEYRYERDEFGDIVSKLGVSVGREFATSEQCHGHRVPMFTRWGNSDQFKEVEDCPPTGCLYCADDNNGAARCGNEELGKAKAVRWEDLRRPVYKDLV